MIMTLKKYWSEISWILEKIILEAKLLEFEAYFWNSHEKLEPNAYRAYLRLSR